MAIPFDAPVFFEDAPFFPEPPKSCALTSGSSAAEAESVSVCVVSTACHFSGQVVGRHVRASTKSRNEASIARWRRIIV